MIINSSIKNYSVEFHSKFDKQLEKIYNEGDVVIVDDGVLLDCKKFTNIRLKAGERTKSYEYLPIIIDKILSTSFSRGNKLIAIGGGTTQDAVSFIASILFRGVDWVFFPTTLLAQGDSCIGGKTSINYKNYKNQLGNYNPPDKVIICDSFLETLNDIDIKSGLGEMLHFFLVSSKSDTDFFQRHYKSSKQETIRRCLEIKKEFIELDEFDRGVRLLLNYGHTFGHAIENVTNYKYPHGISVCFGMDMSNFISMKLGYIDIHTYENLQELIFSVHNISLDKKISIESFITALKKDKKNNMLNNINCVLTRGVGDMFLTNIEISEIKKLLGEYGLN